jgi:hypothetical protein
VFPVLQQQCASGGDNTSEIQSLTSQGENLRSGLNWLCLTMSLLKALFLRAGTIFKVKIYDIRSGDDDASVLFPFLEASLLER